MDHSFENVDEIIEPVVDLNVAKRTIMTNSLIRAVGVAIGVGVGASAMKIKPTTAVKAAIVPALLELGVTYTQLKRASEIELLDQEALTSTKTRINDAALNFILGATATVCGCLITRALKDSPESAE